MFWGQTPRSLSSLPPKRVFRTERVTQRVISHAYWRHIITVMKKQRHARADLNRPSSDQSPPTQRLQTKKNGKKENTLKRQPINSRTDVPVYTSKHRIKLANTYHSVPKHRDHFSEYECKNGSCIFGQGCSIYLVARKTSTARTDRT